MEVAAHLKHARISAQKCRLIVDMIRGLPVNKAMEIYPLVLKRGLNW